MTFERLVWGCPFLTLALLGIGVLLSSRRRQDTGDDERRSAVKFARALTLLACFAAVYLTLTTATSVQISANILELVFLILGPVAGLAAFALLLWNARGLERVVGPAAALVAFGNMMLFVWVLTRLWW